MEHISITLSVGVDAASRQKKKAKIGTRAVAVAIRRLHA